MALELTRTLTFRLRPELYQQLVRAAEIGNRSVSEIVRLRLQGLGYGPRLLRGAHGPGRDYSAGDRIVFRRNGYRVPTVGGEGDEVQNSTSSRSPRGFCVLLDGGQVRSGTSAGRSGPRI